MSITNKHMLVACSTEIFSQPIFSFIRTVYSHLWSVWDVFTSYEQCYQINDKKVVWYMLETDAINIEIKMLFCSILWVCVYDWFFIWLCTITINTLRDTSSIVLAVLLSNTHICRDLTSFSRNYNNVFNFPQFLTMINNQMPTYDKTKFVCYKKIVFQLPYFSNIWVVVATWAQTFHMLCTACKCKTHSRHYRLQNFSTRTTYDTRNDIKLFCVA